MALPTYTLKDIAYNNGVDKPTVWIIISNQVYDVTKFIDEVIQVNFITAINSALEGIKLIFHWILFIFSASWREGINYGTCWKWRYQGF